MAEDKKVITVDDTDYTEDQLTVEAKGCISHLQSLDQKIASAQFNLIQLQGGREFFLARLKAELSNTKPSNQN